MNLDARSARIAGQLVDEVKNKPEKKRKEVENTIRNALGVMREEGLYAFYIYLQSSDAELRLIWDHAAVLLSQEDLKLLGKNPDLGKREELIRLTENLSNLLMARQLVERYLTYALYGLRAVRKAHAG